MNYKTSGLDRWGGLFHYSALMVLVITAACKLVSVMGEAKVLVMADPIFRNFSTRQMLMVAALMELGVAWYLWRGRNAIIKSYLLFWMCGLFIAYRIGLWMMNYKGCSCVGTVAQWLPVSPATVDVLMKVILVYMTVGSAFFLIVELVWDKGKKAVENAHAD